MTSDGIRHFKDLVAWQRAFSLGLSVYRLTETFPRSETYGLSSQMRRGAVSIASNIAEGYGRGSRVDYVRFLKIARGALYELDTQLAFAASLGYAERHQAQAAKRLLDEAERVLAGLIRSLN